MSLYSFHNYNYEYYVPRENNRLEMVPISRIDNVIYGSIQKIKYKFSPFRTSLRNIKPLRKGFRIEIGECITGIRYKGFESISFDKIKAVQIKSKWYYDFEIIKIKDSNLLIQYQYVVKIPNKYFRKKIANELSKIL